MNLKVIFDKYIFVFKLNISHTHFHYILTRYIIPFTQSLQLFPQVLHSIKRVMGSSEERVYNSFTKNAVFFLHALHTSPSNP